MGWIQFAAWVELLLMVTEGAFHPHVLPLGGSGISQAGVLMVAAFLVHEAGCHVERALGWRPRRSKALSAPAPYIGPERRVCTDARPWVGGRRKGDLAGLVR